VSDAEAAAKLVHNEQMKLGATLFNNVAAAFIVTGFIVPTITYTYRTAVPQSRYWIGYAVFWLATAGLNHQIARYLLSRMRP
jgi:hypothetical protein